MYKKILISCFLLALTSEAKFIGEAGYGYNYYKYSEPGLMRIEGNLHTLFTKIGYLGDTFGLEGNYATTFNTDTKYFGSTMSGTPINNRNSKDSFWNIDFKFGKRMDILGDNYDGLAYIGIGYRYLKNRVSGQGGYTREQVYYYLPMGFYAIDGMTDNLSARYGIELRYMFIGTNKTHLGEADPSINPAVLKFTQKNNFGLKVHTGFEYEIGGAKIFTQVSADYWYVRDSNIARATFINNNGILSQGFFLEPNNNTVQIGIEVGAGF